MGREHNDVLGALCDFKICQISLGICRHRYNNIKMNSQYLFQKLHNNKKDNSLYIYDNLSLYFSTVIGINIVN
jgi:hypothetical protein